MEEATVPIPYTPQARGGTELMVEALLRRLPKGLADAVHISVSAVEGSVRHLKPHIFWAHQSYDQPSVQNLKDPRVVAAVDMFVFVSEWQRSQYLLHFPIPPEKTVVIRNAIVPIFPSGGLTSGAGGPMRLAYTSTPFRGLDVLLDAFALLKPANAELHIYSGMSLYGRPEEDKNFLPLYERARNMPNVFYHGAVSNEEVREAVQGAHIFAYPSTWEETSCIALIEAMSAGCLAVVPALGALPETAAGFARLYPYEPDKKLHAMLYARALEAAIGEFWLPETQKRLTQQKEFFNAQYSWELRVGEWEKLVKSLLWGPGTL